MCLALVQICVIGNQVFRWLLREEDVRCFFFFLDSKESNLEGCQVLECSGETPTRSAAPSRLGQPPSLSSYIRL